MTKSWMIEPGAGDTAPGLIEHTVNPRFRASWDTGPAVLETITGPCWSFDASGSDDAIHIYDFTWSDKSPAQDAFEKLMDEAASAIDAWITERF